MSNIVLLSARKFRTCKYILEKCFRCLENYFFQVVRTTSPCVDRLAWMYIKEVAPETAVNDVSVQSGRMTTYEPFEDELRNVLLSYRILPPGTKCTDCRAPAVVICEIKKILFCFFFQAWYPEARYIC